MNKSAFELTKPNPNSLHILLNASKELTDLDFVRRHDSRFDGKTAERIKYSQKAADMLTVIITILDLVKENLTHIYLRM